MKGALEGIAQRFNDHLSLLFLAFAKIRTSYIRLHRVGDQRNFRIRLSDRRNPPLLQTFAISTSL